MGLGNRSDTRLVGFRDVLYYNFIIRNLHYRKKKKKKKKETE